MFKTFINSFFKVHSLTQYTFTDLSTTHQAQLYRWKDEENITWGKELKVSSEYQNYPEKVGANNTNPILEVRNLRIRKVRGHSQNLVSLVKNRGKAQNSSP